MLKRILTYISNYVRPIAETTEQKSLTKAQAKALQARYLNSNPEIQAFHKRLQQQLEKQNG